MSHNEGSSIHTAAYLFTVNLYMHRCKLTSLLCEIRNMYLNRCNFLVLLCFMLVTTNAKKILLACANPLMASHSQELHMLASVLVEKGHEVHSLLQKDSNMELQAKQLGILALSYESNEGLEKLSEGLYDTIHNMIFYNAEFSDLVKIVSKQYLKACENIMRQTSLLANIRKMKFDLMIVDLFPLAPC